MRGFPESPKAMVRREKFWTDASMQLNVTCADDIDNDTYIDLQFQLDQLSPHFYNSRHDPAHSASASNAEAHPTTAGSDVPGGMGKVPSHKDGWCDTTATSCDSPPCYNGAEYSQSATLGHQPNNTSMVTAIVPSRGYAERYHFVEIARFNSTAKNDTAPAASLTVHVTDECASGCQSRKNMIRPRVLSPLDLGQTDVK